MSLNPATGHTPEPWRVNEGDCFWDIMSGQSSTVVSCGMEGEVTVSHEDACHIVSCVNSCAGINPESIPAMRNLLDLIRINANTSFPYRAADFKLRVIYDRAKEILKIAEAGQLTT